MAALSALQTDLRLKLNDASSRILTSAQQLALLNEALEKWNAETEEIWQENAYDVVAKQFYYTGPTDLLRVISARYGPSGFAPLEVVNAHEFEQGGGWALTSSGGIPRYLIVEGQSPNYLFRVWPPPTATSATTTVSGSHNTTVATISVAAVSGFRSPAGWAKISSEKIIYQNTSSADNQLLLCRRGVGQTTAASYTGGETVTQLDLFVTYVRRPTALSASTDAPEIDARWHKDLVYYAWWNGLLLDGQQAKAAAVKQLWDQKVKYAKREVARARGAAPAFLLHGGY